MHSRKYVFDYYDSSRLCNFMNMNGLYVCSRFSRYFAGSLGEDKTNCNAVRWLPDDDDNVAGERGENDVQEFADDVGNLLSKEEFIERLSLCLSLFKFEFKSNSLAVDIVNAL